VLNSTYLAEEVLGPANEIRLPSVWPRRRRGTGDEAGGRVRHRRAGAKPERDGIEYPGPVWREGKDSPSGVRSQGGRSGRRWRAVVTRWRRGKPQAQTVGECRGPNRVGTELSIPARSGSLVRDDVVKGDGTIPLCAPPPSGRLERLGAEQGATARRLTRHSQVSCYSVQPPTKTPRRDKDHGNENKP